ncbi:hypothetical protein RRF57_002816 [Xylaria bambusicola]|uniref:Zn(2)-C6 fungal-type domain-containing protein n=1 Tax=Xylaria bambusicola TaxID=326684 RepID=A0AAN7UKU1_9PEZI
MSVADMPMKNEPGGVGSIRFCDLCNKPIVGETAFKRHLAYCRRTAGKPRKRKRSCRECHRAKAKCSFERQCFRCMTRGLVCTYEKPAFAPANSESGNEVQDSSTPEPDESSPSDCIGSPGSSDLLPSYETTQDTVYFRQIIPPRSAAELRRDPKHQANAIFLLETLRCVPYMMSRRENFPTFLHRQWHKPEVPITITNCMRICELYIARNTNPHGRELFYTALSEEGARFAHQLFASSREDIADMLMIQSLYATMAVFDDYRTQGSCMPDLMVRECDMNLLISLSRQCFRSDNYEPFDVDKNDDLDQTWEQFIYAESRRRCALFWFIVSRVIDLQHGLRCPPVVGYRGLSLPAPGILWNARTREEWEAARAEIRAHRQEPLYNTTLRTMGDLIECRERACDPDCARQLSNWLAGCDKLGLMIDIASTMV